jgi:hypothetical protein
MHECTITSSGYDAINFRRKYQDDYDNLAENLLGINYKTFDSIQPVNLLMVEEPFEVKFNKSMEMETIEEKIMIDPFCSLVITENPMKQTERTYPIDFTYNSSQSFSTIIEVPEGYRLLNKPENMIINNPFGRVVYVIKEDEGNKVSVIAHFQFTKTKYEGSAYKDLKEIYNSVINKFNEKIVLVKNDANGVI